MSDTDGSFCKPTGKNGALQTLRYSTDGFRFRPDTEEVTSSIFVTPTKCLQLEWINKANGHGKRRPQHVGQAQIFGFFWRERLGFGRICQRLDQGGFITAMQVAVLVTFYRPSKNPSFLMRL